MAAPFNARAVFWLRSDRLYRVYCANDSLRFIRIGGQNLGLAYGLKSSQLGSLGTAIAKRIRARELEKLRRAELEADSFDPEFLISRHRHNFRLLPHEVTEARILPAGAPIHGPHHGRWQLSFSERSRLRMQFESPKDLEIALDSLPRVLGDSLIVDQELFETG